FELKRDANAKVILNQLFKHTPLQISYGIILLAILNGEPKILNLKESLLAFIEHRKEVVTRRTAFDLKKAEEKAHILEGLKKAIEHLDEVVSIIRRARNPEMARDQLISRFEFTEAQAQAILDLKLQRLTTLEREKIIEEHRETLSLISKLKEILSSEAMIIKVIKDELAEIKERYSDERRTRIIEEKEILSVEDLIAEEDMVVTVTHSGYLKRSPLSIYRKQRRGGRGTTGILTKDEDFVEHLFIASTHDYLLFFTNKGRVYWLKVHAVPHVGRLTKGKPIIQLVQIQQDEKITAISAVREFKENHFVLMATQMGFVKKTDLKYFSNPRSSGIIAIGLDEGDTLIGAKITSGGAEIILATENGKAIRFREDEIRETGRIARGVKGITLSRKDRVVGMEIITDPELSLVAVTERGFAKRSRLSEYRRQKRGGSGIKLMKSTEKTGKIVGILQVSPDEEIMIITDTGKILRTRVSDIRIMSRSTSGVKIINLEERERVASIARVVERENNGSETME
ncbi:MAG: DNA gyrase C-terminal beta-propeller domain-containing protein, partial [Candidatus Aenigmatarchaeota archaeon]